VSTDPLPGTIPLCELPFLPVPHQDRLRNEVASCQRSSHTVCAPGNVPYRMCPQSLKDYAPAMGPATYLAGGVQKSIKKTTLPAWLDYKALGCGASHRYPGVLEYEQSNPGKGRINKAITPGYATPTG